MSWVSWAKNKAAEIARDLEQGASVARSQGSAAVAGLEKVAARVAMPLARTGQVVKTAAEEIGSEAAGAYRAGKRLLAAGARRAERSLAPTDWTLVGGLIAFAILLFLFVLYTRWS